MSGRIRIPVLLDLTGLRVLFVGAGEGTRMKLAGLVDFNPLVRIVAPVIDPEVRTLAARLTDVQVYQRPFVEVDLDGIALVYGFTDDPALNARLADLCRLWGLWSNVAQNRGALSFSTPAVARHGGIIAAFGSEAGEPALSVAARDEWLGKR
jgi:siroheme synthase-like protein